MIVSIVVAIFVLAVLIIVHEAGHFVVAKNVGVRVIRFSVGYPPRIWGFRRGETEYALGATPFGGYVRMLGDEVGEESGAEDLQGYLHEVELDLTEAHKLAIAHTSTKAVAVREDVPATLISLATGYAHAPSGAAADNFARAEFGRALKPEEAMLLEEIDSTGSVEAAIASLNEKRPAKLVERFRERAFPNQSLAKRFAIVLAGPFANIIFAPILLTFVFLHGVPYLKPVLGSIEVGTPAAMAGLHPGDTVTAINGKPATNWDDLSTTVKASQGAALTFDVTRPSNGSIEHLTFRISPRMQNEKNGMGGQTTAWVIGVLPRGDEGIEKVGALQAFPRAVEQSVHIAVSLVVGIAQIVDGTTPVRQALGGPIMIAQLAGREAHQGFASLALFVVMLSLELGIINLLPVPMLDGGHLLFFVFEAVRGKPLKLRHREIALQVGLLLLVALMAFVIFNDISRIVHS